jgi:hypothetical protein
LNHHFILQVFAEWARGWQRVGDAERAAEDPSFQHFIPRIDMRTSEEYHGVAFPVIRKQFPVVLGLASTVDGGQGNSFAEVVVDAIGGLFSHGQCFVAVTRARAAAATTFLVQQSQQFLKNPLSSRLLEAMGLTITERAGEVVDDSGPSYGVAVGVL